MHRVDQLTRIDIPFDTSPLRWGGPLCPPAQVSLLDMGDLWLADAMNSLEVEVDSLSLWASR